MNTLTIRPFDAADFVQVQAIYQQGIDTHNATFQLEQKTWSQWQSSMIQQSCIVMVEFDQQTEQEKVLGWAGLSAISARPVYKGVGEVSVYVANDQTGRGIGNRLLKDLIDRSESMGFWTLQAAIFPENTASIQLHLKNEFEQLAKRKALGEMHNKWRDVLLLERRSKTVGI